MFMDTFLPRGSSNLGSLKLMEYFGGLRTVNGFYVS